MESAVVYCRKSDPNATSDDESFENQEDTCRAYARDRGYSVLKVYREAHTGADLAGRVQVWEAIDDVRHGDASVLLVRNFDRLARKPEHQAVIIYEVEDKAGGRVEAALEPVDKQDAMARMTRSILAVVAEAERVNAVARMERGKRRRVARGELPSMSNPMFGYWWADDEPGKRSAYAEDPETAPVVRRIYNLAKSGQSLRSIAKTLNAEQVPTPAQVVAARGQGGRHRVGGRWVAEQVRRILIDRTYIGELTAYKAQTVKTNGHVRRTPTDDAQRILVNVPALVDDATFAAVQKTLQLREQTGRPPIDGEASWLRGHVYCGCCGSRMDMHRKPGTDAYIYQCRNRHGNLGEMQCDGGSFTVRSHLLDSFAYDGLAKMVGLPEPYPLRALMVERLGTDKTAALASMAESYAAQIADKRADLDTARRRSLQTRDDELAQQYMRDAEALNAEIHKLEQDYAEAREQLDTFNTGNAWIDATLDRIRQAMPHEDVKPTEADIRALPLSERRLLLSVTGLYLAVYPVGYRGDGKRVVVQYRWAVDPVTNAKVSRRGSAM